ncbi:MAG: RNA methyltransferase [Planctomycetes bacterium]|nr:RNA methyltransferase [Planctomycetota bacterium]
MHAELRDLKMARVERQVGGVRFEGKLADAQRANLELRTAVRVLWRQTRFQATDTDLLYRGAQSVDWSRFLRPEGTLRVDAQSKESTLEHTLFVAQRVKDAVVDQFRERTGARPAVDKDAPDLPIHVHLFRDRCTLSVDTSGDSLHLRGWRRFQGRAPLAETLGAALVLASEWDARAPLVDPFCGSGTVAIEAALVASDTAPGLFRERFAFQRWPGHDAAAWSALREAAHARIRPAKRVLIHASDADARAVEGARENAAAAGVEAWIRFEVARAETLALKPGWNAWIVTNPPYGERIGDDGDLRELYPRFGALLRERCAGYRVALLSGNPRLARALGVEPKQRIALENGGLACELLLLEP